MCCNLIKSKNTKSISNYIEGTSHYNVFIITIISLLGINFLLYGFFPFATIKNVVRLLIMAVILFYIFTAHKEYSFREIFCVIISMYLLLLGGNMTLNISFIILTSICMTDCKDVEKVCFICSAVLVTVVVFSLSTHIVEANVYVQGNRIRNTLGFYNVNAGSLFLFSTLILFLFSRKKISIVHIIISLSFSIILYRVTNSRTSLIGLVLFCITYILTTKCNKFANIIMVLDFLCLLSPILWLISKLNDLEFDKLLSGRLHSFLNYIQSNSTMSLLMGGSNVNEIDNFYLMLLYNVGLILYVLFGFITLYSIRFYKNSNNYKSISYISSILFIGLMESGALRCEIICMLVFWMLILKPFISINNYEANLNSNNTEVNNDV